MAIMILTVGKRQSAPWSELADEYAKRIRAFDALEIKYVKDSGEMKDDSKSAVREESERLLTEMKKCGKTILLDREGRQASSEDFAALLDNTDICFVIGGSYGVDERVKREASVTLSFSKMTFPHRLFRIMLLEQIYRGFTINRKMRYHK